MTKKNDKELIKELFEIVVLVGLIVIRLLPVPVDNLIIKVAGYIGVLVSAFDLYLDAAGRFSSYDKFHVVRGCAYTLLLLMAILLVLFLTEIIKLDDKWGDIFTLLALLITLPKGLYIQTLAKYVFGGNA